MTAKHNQSANERLFEMSQATIDAGLFGAGFLMLEAGGRITHLPLEAVTVDVTKLPAANPPEHWDHDYSTLSNPFTDGG